MNIHITDLLPLYFDISKKEHSEIWGKDINWESGEFIKIVAPSGSGKTSLMHFLYGMRNEYSGSIKYGEKSLHVFSTEDIALYRKDHISTVFQDMKLFPEESVWNNIDIKRQLNPYHPSHKINEMAERLGIASKLNSKARRCSYGEQQRIAIIRSMMQPFDFLLLDEPFSHLDNNNSIKAMDLIIEESKKRNAGIVFADLERIDYFPFTKIYHL